MTPSTRLDPALVLRTVGKLCVRIEERFPKANLVRIARELEAVCERSQARLDWIQRPIWTLRVLRYLLVTIIVLGLTVALWTMREAGTGIERLSFGDYVALVEAAINDVIFIALAVFFVWGLENRVKRRRSMQALHELRSIAHVIDMHQLTKDPDRLFSSRIDTEHSPPVSLDAFALRRYLDYCSELLSLTSKVAAMHLQSIDDPTVVATVNEIEDLTTGLSRKIWQKIELVRGME